MLHCLYHPIDDPRVVDNEEREKLLATGVWFDHPQEAIAYRERVEKEIKQEPKPKKAKVKLEEVS